MKTYSTKDFYQSALLMCKGFKFTYSTKEIGGVRFFFEIHDEYLLKKIIDDFNNCEATVNLKKLVKIQAFLRSELDKHKK